MEVTTPVSKTAREPVAAAGVLGAIVALVGFGIAKLTGIQIDSEAVTNALYAGGLAVPALVTVIKARGKVTPVDDPKDADGTPLVPQVVPPGRYSGGQGGL